MTPKDIFDKVWLRCDSLSLMYAYMKGNMTKIISPDEILRAELAFRVSALDLYVHELISQRMRLIFLGRLKESKKFSAFQLPLEVFNQIKNASNSHEAASRFELEVRRQLSFVTYQLPEKIADGIRLCSDVSLWAEIAVHQGASISERDGRAKSLKTELSLIIDRRNKIVHEGDIIPKIPFDPWSISANDLSENTKFIRNLVESMDNILGWSQS